MKNNISLTQTANFFDNAFKVIHHKYYKYWKVAAQNIWAHKKWIGFWQACLWVKKSSKLKGYTNPDCKSKV